jgi:PAS domain S-box-containing protein
MSRLKALPQWSAGLVILVGALVLCGWIFDVSTLKTVFPGLVSMKVNTAICFILAGSALWLQVQSQPVPSRRTRLARLLALPVVATAFLTLAEYVLGVDLGLDHFFFRETAQEAGNSFPGRMAPATAFNFMLLGMALMALDLQCRRIARCPAQHLTLTAAVITLLAFIGYFYGIETLHRIGPYSTIALNTVIAFGLLCLGIVFARPQRGIMAVFASDRMGGMLARRLLPAAILLPLLVGWLRVLGERAGLYGLGFGTALFATVIIVTFTALIVWAARALDRADALCARGALALSHTNARLDGIISSAMDAVISVNAQQRIVLFNPAAEKMFGVPAGEAIGRPIAQFIPERFYKAHARHVENFGKTGLGPRTMRALEAVTALRADGQEFAAEASLSHVEVAGERLFTVVLRDVAARQRIESGLLESERREHARRVELETLMEVAPAMVWIAHDPECRQITGNRAAQEMLRVSAGANVSLNASNEERPHHFQVFKDGRPLADHALPMRVAAREGRAVLAQELQLRFADGTSRWIYGNAVPLLKADGLVRGVVAAFVDITAFKETQQELNLSREELRSLAARLLAVREEERTRVAREIHDVLAQELTRLKIDIAWLKRRLAQPLDPPSLAQLQDKLTAMLALADTSISSVQRIATELRPVVLDSLGLAAAIEWQAQEFEARTGTRCAATVPDSDLPLDRDSSTALFRILQESLTNVARHAEATRVQIELRCDSASLTLSVQDNGRGIRSGELSDPYSLGLVGMRERAALLGGQCRITGAPEGGTIIEARLPLRSKDNSVPRS